MALLLLFLFTMLALSVNLAMQSELFSAAHPRLVARMLYAAESGVGVAVARALASGEIGSTVLSRQHRQLEEGGLLTVEERLEIDVGVGLSVLPCDYCSVEVRDTWSEQAWPVVVRASRGPPGMVEGDRGRSFAAFSAEAEIRMSPLPFRSECVPEGGTGELFSARPTLVARLRVGSTGYEDPEPRCLKVITVGPGASGGGGSPALLVVEPGTGQQLVRIEIDGTAMSPPAGVDRDLDGVLDYLYVGTAAGSLYRIDVRSPMLESSTTVSPGRYPAPGEVWSAERVLRIPGRAVTVRPSAFFAEAVDVLGLVAVFGPRDEAVAGASASDRQLVAVLLDDESIGGGGSREEDYRALAWGDRVGHHNLLLDETGEHRAGWILALGQYERVVGPAFVLSGLLTLDVRRAAVAATIDDCEGSGPGSVYRLQLTNGDPADGERRSRPLEGCAVRSFGLPPWEENALVLEAFSRREFRDELSRIETALRAESADRCRFGAFFVHAVSERSVGAPFPLARIPVCVTVSNWLDL